METGAERVVKEKTVPSMSVVMEVEAEAETLLAAKAVPQICLPGLAGV